MTNPADFLRQAQNTDGGWGYRVGGVSYVEPTAAVMLALDDPAARQRARDFLRVLQHADGGWGIGAMDAESGWMTAWAVWALAGWQDDAVARGARWLIETEGMRVTEPVARARIRDLFQIDSTLRGWSWQRGDAAWVHPTALALCALSAAGQREHTRVREGVAYLLDRALPSGGWNIGNPQMIDKPIPATIQDTAVALLALRAANVASDVWQVTKGIAYLRGALAHAQTAAELAWGILGLGVGGWGLEIGDWRLEIGDWRLEMDDALARLRRLQREDGSWGGNPFITAIAMLVSQK